MRIHLRDQGPRCVELHEVSIQMHVDAALEVIRTRAKMFRMLRWLTRRHGTQWQNEEDDPRANIYHNSGAAFRRYGQSTKLTEEPTL